MTVKEISNIQRHTGLSTDSKPAAPAGSWFDETNSGIRYICDGAGGWTPHGVIPNQQSVSLKTSAAETATGVETAVSGLGPFNSATIMLDVTVLADDVDDTLDVMIQRLMPDGVTYDTIAHFLQDLGNGSARAQRLDIAGGVGDNKALEVDDDVTTLANVVVPAGSVLDVPWGDTLRVAWIIVDPTGSDAAFTFSVIADFRE